MYLQIKKQRRNKQNEQNKKKETFFSKIINGKVVKSKISEIKFNLQQSSSKISSSRKIFLAIMFYFYSKFGFKFHFNIVYVIISISFFFLGKSMIKNKLVER